jgi:hypothetical protein
VNYLIVQTQREYFEKTGEFRDGESKFWFLNRRVRRRINLGDVVYFWGSGGDLAAMYGWSIVTEIKDEPRKDPRAGTEDFEISFERVCKWPTPLLKLEILREAPTLAQMHIVRAPEGALFPLKSDEARALNAIIRGRDFQAPDDPPQESSNPPRDSDRRRMSELVDEILRRAARIPQDDGGVTAAHVLHSFADIGRSAQRMTAPWFLWRQLESVWEKLGSQLTDNDSSPPAGFSASTLFVGVRPLRVTPAVVRLIDDAVAIAKRVSDVEIVAARHLLATILNSHDPEVRAALQLLSGAGVDPEVVRTRFRISLTENGFPQERDAWRAVLKPRSDARIVSDFSGDDPTTGTDCLGFEPDYQAMASLIASRGLQPPLAIGIFGNWGSGKSFFMHKLEKQVEHLTAIARSEPPDQPRYANAYWRRVKQIKFNAWHYVDSNLWASLVAHVFDELAKPLEATEFDPTAEEREKCIKESNVKKQALSAATMEVDSKTLAVTDAKNAVSALKTDFEAQSASLTNAVKENVWEVVGKAIKLTDAEKQGLKEARLAVADLQHAGADIERIYRQVNDFATTAGRIRAVVVSMLTRPSATLWALGCCIVVLLLAAIVPLVVPVAIHQALATSMRVIALISGTAVWVTKNATSISKAIEPLEKLRSRLAAALDQAEREKAARIAAAEQHLEKVKAELSLAVAARGVAERELRQSYAELKRIEAGGLVSQFIEKRFASEDYRRHLGIVSLVRCDFDQLSSIVQSYNASSAAGEPTGIGLSRIVLYIDDLDRCPPDRVVEVLQAIHLLLAFKLFVVVVGVDARWVTYSLKEQYKGMLVVPPQGRVNGDSSARPASPYDYLEKIFQIPYWITPMSGGSSRSLLRSLVSPPQKPASQEQAAQPGHESSMGPTVVPPAEHGNPAAQPQAVSNEAKSRESIENNRGDDPGTPQKRVITAAEAEPRALEIEAVEAAAMQQLAIVIGRSPRSLKRFVNVYRLIRASLPHDELPLFKGSADSPGPFRAAMLLLAFVVGLPELADDLVSAIEQAVEQGKEAQAFAKLLERLSARQTSDPEEWERLQAFRTEQGSLGAWGKLTAGELIRWTDRIVQYSFIPPVPPPNDGDGAAPPAIPRRGAAGAAAKRAARTAKNTPR